SILTPASCAIAIASAAPFSGLNLPAKTAPDPAVGEKRIFRVGMYGGRIASTETIRRHAFAWVTETHATTGGGLRRPARRIAPATAASGGRWMVCTTGALSADARLTAGASKAWLCTTSYRPSRTFS